MIKLTNENSLAAKIMMKEILTLMHDSLLTLTLENIETYHSVLDVLQKFIIKNVQFKTKEEENANSRADKAIVDSIQSLLNKNLTLIAQKERHLLKEALQQILVFFSELANTNKEALKCFSLYPPLATAKTEHKPNVALNTMQPPR